jgi:3',5'-cyclic-AMP phosphodiesterase
MAGFYIAQLTDIHLGDGLNPKEAKRNLLWALEEITSLSSVPELILVTGDLVCAGRESELREYKELIAKCPLPVYALPANHDLWGEADESAWLENVGPIRQSVDVHGVRILLWNDVQRQSDGSWSAGLEDEQHEWLSGELDGASGAPILIAQHSPILRTGDDYHEYWRASNAPELLALLAKHNVLAMLTGHWHRNAEWTEHGIRIINTGALCGWQYNDTPPHFCFPTRPGYRLLHFDGETLRTFWRDGSYWNMAAPTVQVVARDIDGAYSGGPRPQVRTLEISGRSTLTALAYADEGTVDRVEWSLTRDDWRPMTRTFDGVWSEWTAEINPAEFRTIGEHVCIVRVIMATQDKAYDAIPVRLAERECAAPMSSAAHTGRETVFELFYRPE